jgi:acetaldehyde dehydrogenase
MSTVKVAIVGSGNIGTDLMYKLLADSGPMELAMVAGIDPRSEGLARASGLGIATTHEGIEPVLADPDIEIVFDATGARSHRRHAELLADADKIAVDLTPAAIGPYVVPVVNLQDEIDAPNVNLITCGGQATVPLVHAVARVVPLAYAEMVSTIASPSAGPGTRQNIDEFTYTTARALELVGGAPVGKAIIVLNPADPPIMMQNTVYAVCQAEDIDEDAVRTSIEQIVADVAAYVPGYRLKGAPVFERRDTPWGSLPTVSILIVVEGAGDFLPKYAGNLDIMTAAARRVGEQIAGSRARRREPV